MKPTIDTCYQSRKSTNCKSAIHSNIQKLTTLLTVAVLLMATSVATAQEKPMTRAIMMSPQYVLNNALRFEFDFKLDSTNTWLIIAPQFYQKHKDSDDALNHQDYNQMTGVGVDFLMRKYLLRNKSGKGFYYSYGVGYRYLDIQTDSYLWEPSVENNITFYQRGNSNYRVALHGVSIRSTAGFQFSIVDKLMGDGFIGVGMKYAFYDRPDGSFVRFNAGPSDYGYIGTYFVGGFRIGIGW